MSIIRLRRKWLNAAQDLPSTAVEALAECDGRVSFQTCTNYVSRAHFMYVANYISRMRAINQYIAPIEDILESNNDQRALELL